MSRFRHHRGWIILLAFCLSSQSFAQVEKFFAAPGKKDLTEAFVKANDAERAALLAEEKESLTAELAQSLIRRGERFFSQGDYSQALDVCRLAQRLAEQIGARAELARSLNCIGLVYLRQGNYAEALRSYQQSLAISESLKDRTAMAEALCHTGNIHRRQGNYPQALECYQKSLALSEDAGDKLIAARALNNTGNAHREQGNYPQALEYYERSLAICQAWRNKEGEARALKNIGHIHTSQKNYAQALEYYQRSLAISRALPNKVITARALTNIANVYRKQNRHEESLQFAERATEMARQLDLHETLWASRLIAGAAHHFLNQPAEARRAIEESLAAVETLRAQVAGGEQEQQRFFESRVAPYHAMVELLIAQNKMDEAFTYAERAKARVLLDVISSGRINKAMSSEEQEQERRLNDQLVSLNTQLFHENLRLRPDPARLSDLKSRLQKARLDFEAFQTSLYAAHPELKTRRGEAQSLRLEEAGALIDAKTALLEFVVTDEKIFLFTITKQSEQSAVEVKAFALAVNEEDLTDRIERFRRMLSTADNRFARPARQLYDLLLSPAAEQLRGKSQLIIAPDGPLWELPFQALRAPRDRYLIEDCAVFYAPSLTVLREMNKSRSKERLTAPTLLAMGNPASGERKRVAHNDAGLGPLPEAQRQVQALRRIYGRDNSKVYIGADASEERFKSQSGDYRILHLATHGVLDDRNPMYSHLLFAQTSEKEDGMLEAWELMKMDLKADLAALSACETARGRAGRGEGIIGLTWALFVAGVPTTVVSQWKVRSDSAAELMIEFHRQLKARLTRSNERTSAAESLRAAALKLMRDGRYQHPFHWAGFVVIGDGN
jgi:CHAT domain-containing protein/uncharacterized protein HemY